MFWNALKLILSPSLRLCARLFIGARTWDALFGWLIGQAPRIFGGTYAAREHGRKTRDWIYKNQYAIRNDAAGKTESLWDDAGCAWASGLMHFDMEGGEMVRNLELALYELSHNQELRGRVRLGEILRILNN